MTVRRTWNNKSERLWVYVVAACSSLFSQKGALFIHLNRAWWSHSLTLPVSVSLRLKLYVPSRILIFLPSPLGPLFWFLSLSYLYLMHTLLIHLAQSKMISCFIITCMKDLHNIIGLYICERREVVVNTDPLTPFYSVLLFTPCHPHHGSFKCFSSATCFINLYFPILFPIAIYSKYHLNYDWNLCISLKLDIILNATVNKCLCTYDFFYG